MVQLLTELCARVLTGTTQWAYHGETANTHATEVAWNFAPPDSYLEVLRSAQIKHALTLTSEPLYLTVP